jgi:Asp-tRNA(Asn)/Glu-tRNA(Gln) amidotransferase A subunit family amidase
VQLIGQPGDDLPLLALASQLDAGLGMQLHPN